MAKSSDSDLRRQPKIFYHRGLASSVPVVTTTKFQLPRVKRHETPPEEQMDAIKMSRKRPASPPEPILRWPELVAGTPSTALIKPPILPSGSMGNISYHSQYRGRARAGRCCLVRTITFITMTTNRFLTIGRNLESPTKFCVSYFFRMMLKTRTVSSP